MFVREYDSSERGARASSRLGHMVKQIDMACDRRINNNLRKRDLTRSQAFILFDLERHHGRATLKELESDAHVAQSTTWGLVKRLEEKGLLTLEPDPADARAKVAVLTKAGKGKCDEGWQGAMELEGKLDEEFSEEELAQFGGYLQRMLAAVESLDRG